MIIVCRVERGENWSRSLVWLEEELYIYDPPETRWRCKSLSFLFQLAWSHKLNKILSFRSPLAPFTLFISFIFSFSFKSAREISFSHSLLVNIFHLSLFFIVIYFIYFFRLVSLQQLLSSRVYVVVVVVPPKDRCLYICVSKPRDSQSAVVLESSGLADPA